MSSNRRPQDAWRGGAGGAGRPASGPKVKSGSGRKWAVAALVVAALAGGIAALFVLPRGQKAAIVLTLPVGEYKRSKDWPANPWAKADAQRVRDRTGGGDAGVFDERERLVREIGTQAAAAAREDRPLVVYLSALGTVHAGTPYLLPADADPDRPATWLTLDDVLKPLVSAAGQRLLVLDVRPCFDPRVNLPTADVSEEIDAALARKAKANELPFPVLHAHTPADGPVIDHRQGGTAFGLALAHGLGGAADGWSADRAKNQLVSAQELAAFVRDATYTASLPFGGTPQLPRLHGPADDFALLPVKSHQPPADDQQPPLAAYPTWLAAAWTDRDAAIKAGLHLRALRLVRHHTLTTLRAERAFLAGQDPAALNATFGSALGELKAALPKLGPFPPPAHSLAAVRRTDGFEPKVKAAAAALRPVFGLVRSPEFARTEPMAAAVAVKAELAKAKLPPELPPFALAAAVWDELLKEPSLDRVKAFAPLVDALGLKPPPAEFAGVQLILAAKPERMSRLDADAVRAVLEAFAAAERAAVADGRTFPLIRDGLKELDDGRRVELVALFDPTVGFDQMTPAAGRLAGLCKRYELLPARAEKAAEVEQARDEARAALADLADHFPHELASVGGSGECSLKGLADAYRQAEALLRPDADAVKLGGAARQLTDARTGLLPKPTVIATGTPRQLEAALLWPGWPADVRVAAADKLRGAMLPAWPTTPLAVVPNPPAPRSPAVFVASVQVLRNQAELLALARTDVGVRHREAANAFNPQAADAAKTFTELAADVRTQRRGELKKVYDGDTTRRVKIGWAVDPDDVPAGAATPAANPDWFDRQLADREFRRLLVANRYQADAKAFAPLAAAAAETCRQAAELLTD